MDWIILLPLVVAFTCGLPIGAVTGSWWSLLVPVIVGAGIIGVGLVTLGPYDGGIFTMDAEDTKALFAIIVIVMGVIPGLLGVTVGILLGRKTASRA